MSEARSNGAPSLIGASAGSGKTYRLTEIVTAAVDPQRPDPVALEGLVAVTYTQKGAAELASRLRQSFCSAGAHDAAQRLPLAHIGTVHAVCLRLIKEFAIDAGLSPLVDVMPGREERLLGQALEWGLPPELRRRLDVLSAELELRLDPRVSRTDWLGPVHDMMTLARSNRIHPDALPAMAERSAARLLELLGPPEADGDALDAELLAALCEASQGLGEIDDGQKNTAAVRERVADALKQAQRGPLKWSEWVDLAGTKPGRAAVHAVAGLRQVAGRVHRHPRLHARLSELTNAVYEAARSGLVAYEQWKRRRRIIDFVDMLDRALTLVEHPDVRSELAQRFELLVVDELQDTSPVQLALFVRLHQLAGRSSWVGDSKQCIFEYAGADPELMEAVMGWARAAGGSVERLPNNWRSRPELVACANALFGAALARHGYTAGDVCTEPTRAALADLAALPPLGVFALEAANAEEEAQALAEGVRRLLAEPAASPVHDRTLDIVRALRPGDVAVLVHTNAEAERLAGALAVRGVPASIARAGLLSTPEGALCAAALQSLLEPDDALAAAQIEALTGFRDLDPDAWLDDWLVREGERQAARAAGERPGRPVPAGYLARLEPLRAEIAALSPAEAVDRVLAALDLATLCRRWPDPAQRVANLEALRGLAAEYEERSAQQREAATVAGLLRFFDEAATRVLVRDEELASDEQHRIAGPDAVTLVTYHRAKGLEWPVVVLGSLDRKRRHTLFEVSPETDRSSFDPDDPLGGRWIRYFPWPFGRKETTPLRDAARMSPEGVAVAEREERERARLLYVGFTRARDHLVLAARIAKAGYRTAWLDELCDESGAPLLALPSLPPSGSDSAEVMVRDGPEPLRVAARCWFLSANEPPGVMASEPARVWFAPGERLERPPYWIAPSQAAAAWRDAPELVASEIASTGARLPLGPERRNDWDTVGRALHAFLAADLPELDPKERLAIAERLIAAADLASTLAPEAFLRAGDNLRAWVDSRWPGAFWHREVPITGVFSTATGRRRIEGTVDLLVECPDGVVLVDHKSYPGGRDTWPAKAAEYAPQLATYAEALRLAGKRVLEQWVSFAVAGGAVRLIRSPAGGVDRAAVPEGRAVTMRSPVPTPPERTCHD